MFTEILDVTLAFKAGSTAATVPGGQVKTLSLEITPYGFEAELDFWISLDESDDDIYAFFIKPDPIQVVLEVSAHVKPDGDNPPDLIVLTGKVTSRRLFEETFAEVDGNPVKFRRYWLRFADVARALWPHHRPTELYVDKTMKDVFEAHRGEAEITYDLPALTETHAIICLPLGQPGELDHARAPGSREGEASFYDFCHWWAHEQNAVFAYDSKTLKYQLQKEKDPLANAGELHPEDIEHLEVVLPEPPRYNLNVLNALSENAVKEEGSQPNAVQGIRRDVVLRKPVTSAFDAEKTRLNTGLIDSPPATVELTFARFPTISFRPGTYVVFTHGGWSDDLYVKQKKYRVRDLSLRAHAELPSHDAELNMDHAGYDLDVRATLEETDDARVARPPIRAPRFPVLVEGLVVSEEGAEEEETYQVYTDSDTSQDQYKVKIPLWEDKLVVSSFNANALPGHFYFPAVKDQRVLVRLELHDAWIKRFLDWRVSARLPEDTQGNHLLLGKTKEDGTSIQHVYKDKKPVLTIQRTLEKDTELIQLEEGTLILQTKEG